MTVSAGSVKNFDFYPTYIVGILIFLICVAFMLPKYSDRLSILFLNYNRKLLLAIVIFIFLLIIFDPLLIKEGPILDNNKSVTTIVFAVLGGISVPLLGYLNKLPVISIKVLNNNLIDDDGNISATIDDVLNIRILCNSTNQEIVRFMGICFQEDIDKIEASFFKNKDKLFMPVKKLNNGKEYKLESPPELIQPHEFSREYHLNCRDIINAIPEENLNRKSFCIVFNNADGVCFSRLLTINMGKENKVTNKITNDEKLNTLYEDEDRAFKIVCGIVILICLIMLVGNKLIEMKLWNVLTALTGALGTIAAIISGFYQMNKQNKLNRAEKVEEYRPKFACHFISKTGGNKAIVLPYDPNLDQDQIDSMLRNAGKHSLIEIQNISKNSIYEIAIKLIYDNNHKDYTEMFNYSGLQFSQELIIIPGKVVQGKKEKLKKVIIKFTTPGNETGYCVYDDSHKDSDGYMQFIHPIYKYERTNNNEVTVNPDINEYFLSSDDLKDEDYQFDEEKMYKNGILRHNYDANSKTEK